MSQAEDTAEALRLAELARERRLTDEEYEAIEAIAERSPVSTEDYKFGEGMNPVLDFWTALVKQRANDVANVARDAAIKVNLPRLKKVVVMHVIRVTTPMVEAMKAKVETKGR